MNTTLSRAMVFGVLVAILLARSIVLVSRTRSRAAVFQLVGACFLGVVVLAHFAEGLPVFPGLGWGRPNSVGHDIDFVSFAAGIGFLIASMVCPMISRVRRRAI